MAAAASQFAHIASVVVILFEGTALVATIDAPTAMKNALPLEQIRPDWLSRGRGGLPLAQGAATRHGGAMTRKELQRRAGGKAAGIGELWSG